MHILGTGIFLVSLTVHAAFMIGTPKASLPLGNRHWNGTQTVLSTPTRATSTQRVAISAAAFPTHLVGFVSRPQDVGSPTPPIGTEAWKFDDTDIGPQTKVKFACPSGTNNVCICQLSSDYAPPPTPLSPSSFSQHTAPDAGFPSTGEQFLREFSTYIEIFNVRPLNIVTHYSFPSIHG
ncbi:hypothetical protein H4582DRAFT_2001640 [Lactarius indigo]|nr:hypothetical protein H4582DRAFT_2001640 [Lactarius indigo]